MCFKAADVKNMKNKKSYFGGGKVRVNEWNSHFKFCRISKYCLKMTNEEVDVLAYYQELWWWMNGFFLRMETRPELQIFVTEFAGGGQLPYGLGTVLCCLQYLLWQPQFVFKHHRFVVTSVLLSCDARKVQVLQTPLFQRPPRYQELVKDSVYIALEWGGG